MQTARRLSEFACRVSQVDARELVAMHHICEDDARFRVSRKELDVLVDAFIDDSTAEVACSHTGNAGRRNLTIFFSCGLLE